MEDHGQKLHTLHKERGDLLLRSFNYFRQQADIGVPVHKVAKCTAVLSFLN
jgi:hypothetical protein